MKLTQLKTDSGLVAAIVEGDKVVDTHMTAIN